jgi:hypothetical protein
VERERTMAEREREKNPFYAYKMERELKKTLKKIPNSQRKKERKKEN